MKEIGIEEKGKFDIEDAEIVAKVIKAAEMAQAMVRRLEDMETIPGYIVYEEKTEEEVKADELLLGDHKKEESKEEIEDKVKISESEKTEEKKE